MTAIRVQCFKDAVRLAYRTNGYIDYDNTGKVMIVLPDARPVQVIVNEEKDNG